MFKWVIGCSILLMLLVVPYQIASRTELPLDETARAKAPGEFVQLSAGKIHYLWKGPANGEQIVLVHGVAVPQFIFAQASDALVASGYRVLLFDHFGHGYSDRPATSYDQDFFERQMVELFDALDINEPVHIGALSMGGIISANFTGRYPERVKSLSLFAPAGIKLVTESDNLLVTLFKSPIAGNWLWRVFARSLFLAPQVDDELVLSAEKLQGNIAAQADFEGYVMAMRGVYRFFPLTGQEDVYRRLGKTEVPVLAIFGDADEAVHLDSAQILGELVPAAKIKIIADATHDLNIHHWREINRILTAFLELQGIKKAGVQNQ